MRFSILTALILTGFSCFSQTITFQETMMVNRHQTGYSILNIHDPASNSDEYLLAGTVLQQSVSDSTDLRVFRTDGAGAILWEKTYSTGENERCLGIDHSGDGFILTGYADTGSVNAQMFLMQIDANGNILNQRRYESPMTGQTQGLGVQHTIDNGYIVAGFVADGYFNNDPKRSYVMKVDSNLNPVWSRYFDTPWDINRDLDMAENVIEIPGVGYFVSGSVNIKKYNSSPTYNLTDQGVMAMLVDLNGNLLWNSSFSVQDSVTTGHWGAGVRSYFDVSSNQIYLMANNSQAHQFNITVFDLAGNIVNHWDYNSLLYGLAGFDLIESNDPSKLVACALATFWDFGLGSTWYSFNYPPILLEFNKADGTQSWSNLYKVPSEYYGTLPNGIYTPLAGQQPEIFTPDMAVKSRNGGYAVAGNRSNASSYFDLEMIKVANNGWVECPRDTLQFIPQTLTRFISDSVTIDSGFTAAPINFVVDTLGITSTFCAPADTCVCDLEPNFVATTTDSCTWQFTDVSTLDSCYDICNWFWDFGDGDISSLQNPSHTYDSSGVYTICLSAVVCGPNGIIECEDIFCDSITVFCDTCSCEIEPLFTASTTDSCTFQFTDLSMVDTCYDICSWNWTFGDGGISTLQNPSYTYAASSNGFQNVCLQVGACDSLQNPLCDTTICQMVYVECDTCICDIGGGFAYSTQDSCTFQFTDQTTVDTCFNICTWNWTFGDGGTSSSPNPSYTYNSTGWQTVCLQVSACDSFGITGCDTIFCQDIYVECDTCECSIIPGFNYSINHDSCSVSFIDQSQMADTCYNIWAWSWDFGDGNNSSNQNPTHSYSGSGTYTVCQTTYAGSPGAIVCDTTFCQDIYVNCDTCICEIDPGFSYTIDPDSCEVCFEDESAVDTCVEIVGTSWDLFNDGTVFTDSMPCVRYTVNGTYTICLTVSAVANNVQCDTTYCEDIDIHCCDTVSGIWEFEGPPLDVMIYPNPFSDQTTIQLSRDLDNGKVILYDIYGRKMDEIQLSNSIGILGRNQLSNGFYKVVIMEGNRPVYAGKVVID